MQNKDSGTFRPAYADNIKIHQFIEELRLAIKNNPIESFETTTDIVNSLKANLLDYFRTFWLGMLL